MGGVTLIDEFISIQMHVMLEKIEQSQRSILSSK